MPIPASTAQPTDDQLKETRASSGLCSGTPGGTWFNEQTGYRRRAGKLRSFSRFWSSLERLKVVGGDSKDFCALLLHRLPAADQHTTSGSRRHLFPPHVCWCHRRGKVSESKVSNLECTDLQGPCNACMSSDPSWGDDCRPQCAVRVLAAPSQEPGTASQERGTASSALQKRVQLLKPFV